MDSRRLTDLALLGFILTLAGLTLSPSEIPVELPRGAVQLGTQPADVARNLLFFAPFGCCLRLRRIRLFHAALASAAVSATIELLQIFVPGRYPSPWDALANTAGGWLGATCVEPAGRWLRPDREAAHRVVATAGAICLLGLGLSGLLVIPSVPDQPLFAHWMPDFPHLEPYDGQVMNVRLDEVRLPHGAIRERSAVRTALGGDFELEIEALAGAPPDGQSGLFLITDLYEREMLLMGPDRQDLVLRYRDRAAALGFGLRVIRLDSAMARVMPGERIDLRVERAHGEVCIEMRGVRHCGLGIGASRAWSFVAPPWALGRSARKALDVACLGCLFVPLGYAWRRELLWGSFAAAGLTLLLALPRWLPLPPTSVGDLVSAIAGLAFGLALRFALRQRANARSHSRSMPA